MKRLFIALILVLTTFISGAVLTASEINITWEDYFTEVSPGVYESNQTKYISGSASNSELYLNFFDVTKLEIGIKDLFPPFNETYFVGATGEAKQVDFTAATYHEFTGLTFNKSKYTFSYRESGVLSQDVLNYKFKVNDSLPLDLAVYMPSGTTTNYPITVYRFRVTGTPKTRSTQTVSSITKPEMLNGGAVWHSEVTVSGVERAYIHMQLFDNNSGTWVRTQLDNTIKTGTNPVFDVNILENSYRLIRAPHGYSNLMIDNNGQIKTYPGVISIRIEVGRATHSENVYEVNIYDADFSVKIATITDTTKVYWQKVIDTTFDVKIASWNELPKGTQSYDDIAQFEDIENVTVASVIPRTDGNHDVRVKIGDTYYLAQNIVLPNKVLQAKDVYAFYFSTVDSPFIWFFFNEVDTAPQSLVNDSWLIWNLSTGEWRQVLHTTIHGLPWYRDSKYFAPEVFSDISIPYPIDDILSITVNFEYRYHYPFSISHGGSYYGNYQPKQMTLTKGGTQEIEIEWWRFATKLFIKALENRVGTLVVPELVKLTPDEQYKQNFLQQLEDRGSGTYTMANVFPTGSNVYRLHLGTYNKFGSDGVEVKDVFYSDFTYVYQGVEYSEPFPQQDTPNPPVEHPEDVGKTPSWVFQLWLWILDHPSETITIVVIGAIGITFGPLLITLIVRWKDSLSRLKSKNKRRR